MCFTLFECWMISMGYFMWTCIEDHSFRVLYFCHWFLHVNMVLEPRLFLSHCDECFASGICLEIRFLPVSLSTECFPMEIPLWQLSLKCCMFCPGCLYIWRYVYNVEPIKVFEGCIQTVFWYGLGVWVQNHCPWVLYVLVWVSTWKYFSYQCTWVLCAKQGSFYVSIRLWPVSWVQYVLSCVPLR